MKRTIVGMRSGLFQFSDTVSQECADDASFWRTESNIDRALALSKRRALRKCSPLKERASSTLALMDGPYSVLACRWICQAGRLSKFHWISPGRREKKYSREPSTRGIGTV